MSNCNALIGIANGCDDNNAGSIKKAWIADFDDIDTFSLNASGDTVTGITMESSAVFQEFSFKKNTSNYTENWAGDLTADVHLWDQAISIGLRRIEIGKRNAISLLAEGRRRLVVIVLDNNDEYRVFGTDDGLRLSGMESGTNAERAAGTFYTITLTGDERWMAYHTDETVVNSVV